MEYSAMFVAVLRLLGLDNDSVAVAESAALYILSSMWPTVADASTRNSTRVHPFRFTPAVVWRVVAVALFVITRVPFVNRYIPEHRVVPPDVAIVVMRTFAAG